MRFSQPISAPSRFASSRAAFLSGSAFLSTFALSTLTFAVFAPQARADTQISAPSAQSGAVAVLPGGRKAAKTAVAIVSALDTSGNAKMARRALLAADAALRTTPGLSPANLPSRFKPVPQNQTAAAQSTVAWHFPLTGRDYQDFGKALKVSRALSVSVSPGETANAYTATAELYDTKTGGLIGFGRATSTISDDASTTATTATPTLNLTERALDASVQSAVFELSRTASFNAVVISRPGAYAARISLGEKDGVRGGARVEYLQDGQTVAYGTITDVGYGESVATVAPEAAFPNIYVNSQVRIVNNPTRERSLPSLAQIDERDFARFEKQFGLAIAIVGAVYLITAN